MSKIVFTGCSVCRREEFPAGPRMHEGHFALRFGDRRRQLIDLQFFLDGEEIALFTEVYAGDTGYVIRPSRPYRFCETCGTAIDEIVNGQATIRRKGP